MAKTGKITKRRVDALQPGETLWDSSLKGFGVRCQKASKVYVLKTRIKGKQRWITIGTHGAPWTAETARAEALRLWREIHGGTDLANLREEERKAPIMEELCERYLQEHAQVHKKPSSVRTDTKNIENHIIPLLGTRLVADITRADIEKFKQKVRNGHSRRETAGKPSNYRGGAVVTGGPGVANRCIALLSKMFNLAELWGVRPENSNPCRHVVRYKENRRQRFLSLEEFERLGAALTEAEQTGNVNIHAIAAIRLLALTGARLGEILTLKWAYVNFELGFLMLPDSKTGQKPIYLNKAALALLASIPRMDDNPHVIIGRKRGSHLVNLQKPWGRIRKAAGLSDVRIHDLRHSFASIAASSGASLPFIGQLLGHTQIATTQRYAHLAAAPVKELNETIGDKLSQALGVPEPDMEHK